MRICDAIEQNLPLLRPARPELYHGHRLLVQPGRDASSMPEYKEWRIKNCDRRWVPFEYATRVLDIYVEVAVSEMMDLD